MEKSRLFAWYLDQTSWFDLADNGEFNRANDTMRFRKDNDTLSYLADYNWTILMIIIVLTIALMIKLCSCYKANKS